MFGSTPGRRAATWLASVWAAASIAACGGVDSGGTGTGITQPGIVSIGTVTGFGSIVVNQVHFDERGAAISADDGGALGAADIKLGMLAEVIADTPGSTAGGTVTATASSVHLRSEVVGPVDRIDVAQAALVVLGQRVIVTPNSVFDPALAQGLAVVQAGEVLEVFGQRDEAGGTVVATRIQRAAGPADYKLRGAITALDTGHQTVSIRGLTVSVAALPAADTAALAVGQAVRVALQPLPVSGVWQARSIAAGALALGDREAATLDGRITQVRSPQAFSVDGVEIDASTSSLTGDAAGLVVGAHVEVAGQASGGRIVATRVAIEAEGDDVFELQGQIQSLGPAADTFTVRGVGVHVGSSTQFVGGGPDMLAIGQRVEVEGRLSDDGSLVEATQIEFF